MALTFRRAAGADSGGMEQVDGQQGAPAAVTTPAGDADYVYELSGAATKEQVRFARVDGAAYDNDLIVGVKFRSTDATPASASAFLLILGSTGQHAGVILTTGGKIAIIDQGSTLRATGSTTLSDNTWYDIEVRFRRGDAGTGQVEVFLDGTAEVSDSSAGDYQRGSETTNQVVCQGAGSGGPTFYCDSLYIYDGGSSNSDFLLDWKLLKYNKTDGGATDQGSALDSGTWADASATPLGAGATAQYTDNAGKSGGMRTNSGSFSGPSGDAAVNGDVVAAEYVFVARDNTGGGVTDLQYGNSGDGMTAASETLTTSAATYLYPTESATIMPTASEFCELGMSNTGSANVLIVDAWCMVLVQASGATTKTVTLSLDAALQEQKTLTASMDAALQAEKTRIASLDAALAQQATVAISLDAALQQLKTAAASLDAALQDTLTPTASLDAALQIAETRTASIDAVLALGRTVTASLDALLQLGKTETVSLDAALLATQTAAASLDAAVEKRISATASLDAVLAAVRIASASLDAVLQQRKTRTASLDAALQAGKTVTTSLDAAVRLAMSVTAGLDAVLEKQFTKTAVLDAALQAGLSRTASLDAVLVLAGATTKTITTTLDAALQKAFTKTMTLDAAIQEAKSAAASLDAALQESKSLSASLDAGIAATATVSTSLSAALAERMLLTLSLDAMLRAGFTRVASLDAILQQAKTLAASLDAGLALRQTRTLSLDGVLALRALLTTSLSAAIQATKLRTASLDAFIEGAAVPFGPAGARTHDVPGRDSCTILSDGRVYVVPAGGRTH